MRSPRIWSELQETLSPKQIHLIRSTYRMMSEKGVHRISLQDVADAAGVSKGTILYHFKTRENLILVTMRWVLSRVAERIRDSVNKARTPEEKIAAMIDAIFVAPEANRRFYIVYLDLVGYAVQSDQFSRLSGTFRSIVNGMYADLIEFGVSHGTFDVPDVDEAATVVRAIIDGLFLQWMQDEHWQELHGAYKDRCKRAVLSYLKGSRRNVLAEV